MPKVSTRILLELPVALYLCFPLLSECKKLQSTPHFPSSELSAYELLKICGGLPRCEAVLQDLELLETIEPELLQSEKNQHFNCL